MAKTKEVTLVEQPSTAPIGATPVEQPSAPAEQQVQRQERVPVSGPRDILTVMKKDPNYVYRWVFDKPGRIERFLRGGYEVAKHETDIGDVAVDRGSRVGTAITYATGGSQLVLMRQKREWYNEDQEAKWKDLDALEEVLYQDGLKKPSRTLGGTTPSEKETFYRGR